VLSWRAVSAPDYSPSASPPLHVRPARSHARASATLAAARSPVVRCNGEIAMNIHLGLAPIISLLAGILILAMPKLLNYIVAIYLIVIGLIGLFGAGAMRLN
jgi:Protein of unknown function (DUF3096)